MKTSWKVKTDEKTGIMLFSLEDEAGTALAKFRVNPTDIRLASRMEKAAESIAAMREPKEINQYDKELEDQVCLVLGEDARKILFAVMSATTVMPSGELFAVEVIETIHDSVIPELKKRRKKMAEAVEKYTAKYK